MDDFKKIEEVTKNKNKFIIITHKDPDGDAVGSLLALTIFLRKQNKEVYPICFNEISETFSFLPEVETISKEIKNEYLENLDCIFILDCGDLRRTGFEDILKVLIKEVSVINIDHHPSNPLFGGINIVEPKLTSTSEIIYVFLKSIGAKIDKEIATCLLTGIITDTGSFMHSVTSSETLKIASELLKTGVRLSKITLHLRLKTLGALKLWGKILSRVEKDREMGIVTSIITKDDIAEVGASDSDLSGVVNLINSIPGTKASILLSEREPGEIKGSIRTEDDEVDVSEIASLLGGGGHKKAAGFTIKGELVQDGDDWRIE